MDIKNLTTGDIKQWATRVLHNELETIINAKSAYRQPYYILVFMRSGYQGPAAYGNNNELLHGTDSRQRPRFNTTKTVDMSNKRVMTHRFIILPETKKPIVPLVGSSLWYINNKTGQVKCCYILPPDKPMIAGFDVELESETIGKCSVNMPIMYGKEN